jgi:hypothetical protein
MVSPRERRQAVEHLVAERGLPQRHACQLVDIHRASARYQIHPRRDESQTIALIRSYAEEQPMYGYRIMAAMLKQDGHQINRKRFYRIWRQEGLQLPRRKPAKRRYGDSTGSLQRATRPRKSFRFWSGCFWCTAHRAICAVTMVLSLSALLCNNGCVTTTATRCTSSRAVRGRILLSRVSTAPFALHV